jgi:ferritin-like metal-binding protein YciE
MNKNNQMNGKKKDNDSEYADSSEDQHSLLKEFFIGEVKDIYWAEKHLTKVLPKMVKAATSSELKEAFEGHLKETEGHVARLEQVFELLEEKPQAKKCEAMEGITKEGASIIEETEKGTMTRDAGLIMAGQKVEHYEIASYGGIIQLAKTLDIDAEISELLQQTLDEEKTADQKLTSIAEEKINVEAKEESK